MIALLLLGPNHVAATDAAARAYMAEGKVAGMAIAVTHHGRLVYNKGFGTVDPSGTVRPTGSTIFRLGSVSKPMTALMIMHLVEKGKVRLDDDVRHHVPSFPDKGEVMTVRQVLSHTSGIRHYQEGKSDGGHFGRAVDALKVWQNDPLLASPGEKFSYSTHAYTLLGAIVERHMGMTYDKAFGSIVRKKARTATPRVENRQIDVKRRSALFIKEGGRFVSKKPDDLSWKTSGGGLESTAPDLCRVGDALISGKIVSLESFLTMVRPVVPRTTPSRYGLGLVVEENGAGHGGAQLGARSFWRLYPRQGFVVTIMTNVQDHVLSPFGERVGKIWTSTP